MRPWIDYHWCVPSTVWHLAIELNNRMKLCVWPLSPFMYVRTWKSIGFHLDSLLALSTYMVPWFIDKFRLSWSTTKNAATILRRKQQLEGHVHSQSVSRSLRLLGEDRFSKVSSILKGGSKA